MRPKPPPPRLASACDALLIGDTGPFLVLIRDLASWPPMLAIRAWWELSTLYGRVVGSLTEAQEEREFLCMLESDPATITGGAPRRVAEPDAVARAWRDALAEPPGLELHRSNMDMTLRALCAGTHPLPDAADALLRHHTDLPTGLFTGRHPVGPEYGRSVATAAAELDMLSPVLGSPEAFLAHLQAGVTSPSLPRRDLSWRLLELRDSTRRAP